MSRSRLFLITVLAALVPCTVGAAAASAAPQFGIAVVRPGNDFAVDFHLDRAKELGATLVRTEIVWSSLEPSGKGVLDQDYLARVDHTVNGAKARGMKVVMVLNGSPCWASSAPDQVKNGCPAGGDAGTFGPWAPKDPADLGRIAGLLAERYKSGGLAAIEVWNEPDHVNQAYLKNDDKVGRYASMLKATYGPVKKANPAVTVLAGAIVGADGKFLEGLYKAGIKGNYDALSVHYYDLVLASLRSIRQVQRKHGDKKPLWLGEFGWTSCASKQKTQGGHACVSAGKQGVNTVDVLRALRNISYVKATLLYAMQDTPQYDFGVIDVASKPKPIFTMIASQIRTPKKPRKVTLKLRRKGGQVRATGTGPAGDAFEMDVFKGGRLRFRQTFRLDRNGAFSLKVPRQLGSRGLRVRVYQYWLGGGTVKKI